VIVLAVTALGEEREALPLAKKYLNEDGSYAI
jgi:hypothetical protein